LKNSLLIVYFLTQITGVFAQEYMGHKVINMPFPLAGGEIVSLPVTDAGTIPAENEKIKIEVAGYNVGPIPGQEKVPGLFWIFGFTSKLNQKIESVIVQEVFSTDKAISVVDDEAPSMKGVTWSTHTGYAEVSASGIPWLYSNKPTFFVYKFSIKIDGEKVVLYQPVYFSNRAKQLFVDHADKLRK